MNNPILQAMTPSGNAMTNPNDMFNKMMTTNPMFRKFVEDNKGKSAEEIARHYGLNLNMLNNLIGHNINVK